MILSDIQAIQFHGSLNYNYELARTKISVEPEQSFHIFYSFSGDSAIKHSEIPLAAPNRPSI